jgi:hypothetical protein
MDAEAEEAAAEQRAILASFETQGHDRAAQELMAAESRAAAARLAEDHAAARADAHRRNIEAARAAMAEAEQRLFRANVAGGLATVAAECQRREHQYPLPSFDASAQREKECRTSPPSSRKPSATTASARRRRTVATTGWFLATGPMMELGHPTLHRHHHRAHREPTPPTGTPTKTTSFSLFYISPYY